MLCYLETNERIFYPCFVLLCLGTIDSERTNMVFMLFGVGDPDTHFDGAVVRYIERRTKAESLFFIPGDRAASICRMS